MNKTKNKINLIKCLIILNIRDFGDFKNIFMILHQYFFYIKKKLFISNQDKDIFYSKNMIEEEPILNLDKDTL